LGAARSGLAFAFLPSSGDPRGSPLLEFDGGFRKGSRRMDIILDRQSVVQRAEALASAPMGEGLAIMHLDHGAYFVVEGAGLEIWALIEEPVRVADLTAALAADYEVEREVCEAEILRFLEQLRLKALLTVVHRPA
jgi:hypothetical protein